jgi:hypothetical protein
MAHPGLHGKHVALARRTERSPAGLCASLGPTPPAFKMVALALRSDGGANAHHCLNFLVDPDLLFHLPGGRSLGVEPARLALGRQPLHLPRRHDRLGGILYYYNILYYTILYFTILYYSIFA